MLYDLTMETRTIGSLSVSVIGLGCNNFGMRCDAEQSARVVHAALDHGINFFDTADMYGGTRSEEYLGRALGARRASVIVATKFGHVVDEQRRGAHPDYIRRAVEDSLRRLGSDRIDLYQLHKPDPEVPIADTLGALDELVKAGKVREIGASNFSVAQIQAAEQSTASNAARFLSIQNEYSLLQRDAERDVLQECAQRGIAFLPFYPLASGLLSGKYRSGASAPTSTRLAEAGRFKDRFMTPRNVELAQQLHDFASARGRSLLELACSWLLQRPAVSSIIAGATSAEQIAANAAAAGWLLSAQELAELDRIAPLQLDRQA